MARTKHVWVAVAAAAVVGGWAAAAAADVIELQDGRKFSGTMSRRGDKVVIVTSDGATVETTSAAVLRVTLSNTLSREELADTEWRRIAAQVKRTDNLRTVITLHEGFLRLYPEVKLAEQVKTDLAKYQQMAQQGATKLRGEWVLLADADAVKRQWEQEAAAATAFYKLGQMKEALEAVKLGLATDGKNPDLLTVGGLAAFRLNNLLQATIYFTALAAADPGSVLAENNLAVIAFQDKQQQMKGIMHYTKALQIAPDNRQLLDNIAEALHGFTDDRTVATYKALARQHEQAEARVAGAMKKDGWSRWGSTWVTEEQLALLMRRLTVIKDQMAALDAQYRSAKAMLANLEGQIATAQANVVYYENEATNSTVTPQRPARSDNPVRATGSARTLLAMQTLDRARQRLGELQSQRTELQSKVQEFTTKADRFKALLAEAQPQFTGTQRILDLGEGEKVPPPAPLVNPPVQEKERDGVATTGPAANSGR
jgi:tetratricopeptide (TPR) repeat protein